MPLQRVGRRAELEGASELSCARQRTPPPGQRLLQPAVSSRPSPVTIAQSHRLLEVSNFSKSPHYFNSSLPFSDCNHALFAS
eukprot:1614363-Rhodomonas_salina.1